MKNKILFIISLLLFFSCSESQNKKKHAPDAVSAKEESPKELAVNDTVVLDMKLSDKVIKVFSKKDGTVINSELKRFIPQFLDTSTLILAIDNQNEFIRLRKLKSDLSNALSLAATQEGAKYSGELKMLLSSLSLDNLLPRVDSEKFPREFTVWFKNQSFYKLYEQASSTEEGMKDYFFINEKPVLLRKMYVRSGQKVEKGELLFEFIDNSGFLTYKTGIKFNKGDIIKVTDQVSGEELNDYIINDGSVSITRKNTTNPPDLIKINVILKTSLS
ncbi:MAG: hypothetical protein J0G96_12265 [Flavobacteriia bacterium]|nr:hypothetical protein [Flavobacteriia bacterium]OJX39685.1 MAG: hypothetical protein BGO87_01650 [Flavobacteriia bacterium 40-80]